MVKAKLLFPDTNRRGGLGVGRGVDRMGMEMGVGLSPTPISSPTRSTPRPFSRPAYAQVRYAAGTAGITSPATGRVTVNVLPRPRRERTEIVPPCASAIHWLIARPR